MSYIIVWRSGHRDPFVDTDSHGFLETFENYEDAKKEAEEIANNRSPEERHYFDYKIFEETYFKH